MKPIRPALLVLSFGLLPGGCISIPELDRPGDIDLAAVDYPALVPLQPVLAAAPVPSPDDDLPSAGLAARAADLQARAARLSAGPVIDPESRNRLTAKTGP